mgnify:FL=1
MFAQKCQNGWEKRLANMANKLVESPTKLFPKGRGSELSAPQTTWVNDEELQLWTFEQLEQLGKVCIFGRPTPAFDDALCVRAGTPQAARAQPEGLDQGIARRR